MKVLRRASDAVDPRDYVAIVANDGGLHENATRDMLGSIHELVNQNEPDKHHRVFTADASNKANVRENLLVPVLQHLAERLPVMDRAVAQRAMGMWQHAEDATRAVADQIESLLRSEVSPGMHVELVNKAKILRRKLASDLKRITDGLYRDVRRNAEDESFTKAVSDVFDTCTRWIEDTLGTGDAQAWETEAIERFAQDDTSGNFTTDELHRVRVHLSEAFSGIDLHLRTRVDDCLLYTSPSPRD